MAQELPQGTNVRLLLMECDCPQSYLTEHRSVLPLAEKAVTDCEMTPLVSSGHDFPGGGFTLCVILAESHLVVHTYPECRASVIVELSVCDHQRENRDRAFALAHRLRELFSPGRFVLEPASMRPGSVLVSPSESPWVTEPLIHVPLLLHPQPRTMLLFPDGDHGLAQEALRHEYLERLEVVESRQGALQFSRAWRASHSADPAPAASSTPSPTEKPTQAPLQPADLVVLDLAHGGDPALLSQARTWCRPDGLTACRLPTDEPQWSLAAATLQALDEPVTFYWQSVPGAGLALFALLGLPDRRVPSEDVLARRLSQRRITGLQVITPQTLPALFAIPPLLESWLEPIMVSCCRE